LLKQRIFSKYPIFNTRLLTSVSLWAPTQFLWTVGHRFRCCSSLSTLFSCHSSLSLSLSQASPLRRLMLEIIFRELSIFCF
jgi:hypothetical protein